MVRQKVPSLCFGLDQQGTQCEGQAASTALRQGLGCQNCRTAFPEKLEMLQEEGGGGGEERGRKVERGTRTAVVRPALSRICQVLSQVVFRAINSANH